MELGLSVSNRICRSRDREDRQERGGHRGDRRGAEERQRKDSEGIQLLTTHSLKANCYSTARLAQSAERKALNLVVVGSSPTVGALLCPMS